MLPIRFGWIISALSISGGCFRHKISDGMLLNVPKSFVYNQANSVKTVIRNKTNTQGALSLSNIQNKLLLFLNFSNFSAGIFSKNI